MNVIRKLATPLLLLGIVTTRPATAQMLSSQGEQLFQRGRAEFSAGNYEIARSYFLQSQTAAPALVTLLNLAVCEEKLGKLSASLDHLKQALDTAGPTHKRRGLIQERLAQLEARTPHVTVLSKAQIDPKVEVSLDAKQLSHDELGKPLRLDPGVHTLNCSGPHGERCSRTFTIAEGQEYVEVLSISMAAPAPVPPTAEQPRQTAHTSSRRSAAYVLGGFGLASLATGLIAGAAVFREKHLVSSHCDVSGCDADGLAAGRDGRAFALLSTVATTLGVVSLGTSAWLLLTPSPSREPKIAWSIAGSF